MRRRTASAIWCSVASSLQWGYIAPLMATDTVYAVTALLESQSRREGEEASASEAFWCALVPMI